VDTVIDEDTVGRGNMVSISIAGPAMVRPGMAFKLKENTASTAYDGTNP